jgi:hypothetical protein
MFVKGATFLLRPDGFEVAGKDEYNIRDITPVPTLSIPIVNNAIESSTPKISTSTAGNPDSIKTADKISDIAPLIICRARNHAGN